MTFLSIDLVLLQDGQLLHTYSTGAGTGTGVFEVCWNHNGSKLAGSCADHTVCCPSSVDCLPEPDVFCSAALGSCS